MYHPGLSETRLVDHTVMEKLHEMQHEFQERNCTLVICGLGEHRAFSDHPQCARKKALQPVARGDEAWSRQEAT